MQALRCQAFWARNSQCLQVDQVSWFKWNHCEIQQQLTCSRQIAGFAVLYMPLMFLCLHAACETDRTFGDGADFMLQISTQ